MSSMIIGVLHLISVFPSWFVVLPKAYFARYFLTEMSWLRAIKQTNLSYIRSHWARHAHCHQVYHVDDEVLSVEQLFCGPGGDRRVEWS